MKPDIRGEKGLSLGLFIVAIALAGVGIAFVTIAQQTASLAQYARDWTKTPGVITEARVETRGEKDYPLVEYAYTAKDKEHKGRRLFLTEGPYHSVEKIENGVKVAYLDKDDNPVAGEYRKGAAVTVFYNPHLPMESTLNPVVLKAMGSFVLIGLATLAFAIFLTFRSFMYD